MNLIQKDLAAASGLSEVVVGQRIFLQVDLALAHDGSFEKVFSEFDVSDTEFKLSPEKFIVTVDHSIPAPGSDYRRLHLAIKEYAKKYNFRLFDKGEGILHQVIAEKFTPKSGQVIVGADGHVATSAAFGALAFSVTPKELALTLACGKYEVIVPQTVCIKVTGNLREEFTAKDFGLYLMKKFAQGELKGKAVIVEGDFIDKIDIEDKMTICNLLGEMGVRTVRITGNVSDFSCEEFELDISRMKSLVALPPSPHNVKRIEEVKGKKISLVYIGGCTNGRLKDMKITAQILAGKKVHSDVTLIVGPASQRIANEMEEEGISKQIREAGGIIINPGCGACSGIHQGVAGPGDVVLTTTVRNTPGRMGSKQADVLMVSPRVAAYSAVEGEIYS